ncbi:MAG: hypothetical protein Q4B69_04535 [Slackia sp.]|nr:hypothetical protein [Slackia sp.]
MVILITGASHTGKTVLAKKLVERHGFACLSIDLLKMGLIRSGNTSLTPEDDEELEAYLWPIVREIMKTAIENEQDLIVEGCYVPLDWRKDFTDDYAGAIRFCCLAMSERYIEEHFDDIKAHASDVERRLDDEWCTKELLLEENERIIELCRKHGEACILIDERYEVDLEL